MEQYWGVKSAHPDKILFFRMGDFFEIFADDAVLAAPLLGIALTVRNKKSGDNTKMCGMPHHSIAGAVNKLLKAGYKVAICDQLEDPKQAKGLVKRGITRILSPGMLYDPESIDADVSNYIACYHSDVLSFIETSTGEAFFYKDISIAEKDYILDLLRPAELLVTKTEKESILANRKTMSGPHLSEFSEDLELTQDLSSYEGANNLPKAFSRLLAYAVYMQDESILASIRSLEERKFRKYMKLSQASLRHLELFEDAKGDKKNSLFSKINRCKTSTGARLLKKYLAFPLMDLNEIRDRQNKLAYWLEAAKPSMEDIRNLLSEMGDPERRLSKVAGPSCSPRDMQTLKESLAAGLHITSLCSNFSFPQNSVIVVDSLIKKMDQQIVEDAPVSLNKGSYIQKNVDPTLDEYIDLAENAGKKLKEMEESEREKYGIPSLKIRYNNVFGYYIEVTNTHSAKVPDHYQRKQTLTNSERYTTEDLKDLERKILSAKSKKEDLELEIFKNLKSEIVENTAHILAMVDFWSDIDVTSSLAYLAKERSYCKPELAEDSDVKLSASKHPVLEMELGALFVENDIRLERQSGILITGPNMAGKSTVMRQLATLAILAQIGSYVPAKAASLPIFDQIFTRIGASDSLSEGLSTFMVEMTETADIVNSATKRSLVILDEIGRGTSTYDGMSLAKAILEYLLEKSKAMILFSTHYHELTSMVSDFDQLENYHMAIRDDGKNIEFKHRFMQGSANKSYGIHVAKLAGLPSSITKRAEKIQKEMELQNNGQMSLMAFATAEPEIEVSPAEEPAEHNELIDELRDLRIQEMTPLDLMNRIAEWQNRLS